MEMENKKLRDVAEIARQIMVGEELKGGQKKLDKNHNNKIDAQDLAIVRAQKEEVESVEEGIRPLTRADTKFKDNPELKMKRGYINPITNQLFWLYDPYGREVWLHPDEFHRRRERTIQARKRQRANAAQNKLPMRKTS